MRILSTLGVKGVLDVLCPRFEAATGLALDIRYNPTAVLVGEIREGARGDVALLTGAGIAEMIAAGILQAGSGVDLARSKVGLAVPAGAPRPAIGSRGEVIAALLAARCVVYSGSGASGLYFARLLGELGIAAAVNARATIIPAGFTAELLRDGRGSLAVQQVSELMAVEGVDVLGPLPAEIQDDLVFSGGVFCSASAHGQPASQLLRFISAPEHAALYRAKGLFEI